MRRLYRRVAYLLILHGKGLHHGDAVREPLLEPRAAALGGGTALLCVLQRRRHKQQAEMRVASTIPHMCLQTAGGRWVGPRCNTCCLGGGGGGFGGICRDRKHQTRTLASTVSSVWYCVRTYRCTSSNASFCFCAAWVFLFCSACNTHRQGGVQMLPRTMSHTQQQARVAGWRDEASPSIGYLA